MLRVRTTQNVSVQSRTIEPAKEWCASVPRGWLDEVVIGQTVTQLLHSSNPSTLDKPQRSGGMCQWKLDTFLKNLDSKDRVDFCFG